MEPKFNTTFIPKKSLQSDMAGTSGEKFVGRREVRGPGFYLMLMVFVASVVASLGVFGYTKIVESNIQDKIARLEAKKNSFDEATVALLIRADSQLANARKLVMEHVTVSELFALLEQITLKRVQYTELEYEAQPRQNGLVTITGAAKNFQDVALQVEQYRINSMFLKPIVKELERLENNTIKFGVEFGSDPRLVSFSSAIQGENIPIPTQAPATQDTPATPDTSASTAPTPTTQKYATTTIPETAPIEVDVMLTDDMNTEDSY